MKKVLIAGLLILFLASPTALMAMSLSFNIGPYSTHGFSASWLHSASGSPASSDLDLDNDGSNDTLYMSPGSDGFKIALTGMLGGDWDGTILSNITGMLNGYTITGGSLGGAYYSADMNPLWYLEVDGAGPFYYEEMNGNINQINENYLILWGQNHTAYVGDVGTCFSSDQCDTRRLGMDLYGKAKPLPEPGNLLLMILGLVSIAVASRRRDRSRMLAISNRS